MKNAHSSKYFFLYFIHKKINILELLKENKELLEWFILSNFK